MKRIIVGVTGASGTVLALRTLEELRRHDVETHLIVSSGARRTMHLECDFGYDDLVQLADVVHNEHNMGASVSSGSFRTDGMVIVPCSMKTLAGITSGFATNLVGRAADVCLKEERRVVLVPREMPLGKVHLRNMKEAADLGCVVVPPMLTFYNAPQSLDDQVNHVVGKVVRMFDLEPTRFVGWRGAPEGGPCH